MPTGHGVMPCANACVPLPTRLWLCMLQRMHNHMHVRRIITHACKVTAGTHQPASLVQLPVPVPSPLQQLCRTGHGCSRMRQAALALTACSSNSGWCLVIALSCCCIPNTLTCISNVISTACIAIILMRVILVGALLPSQAVSILLGHLIPGKIICC
jgi:hypothetical protein